MRDGMSVWRLCFICLLMFFSSRPGLAQMPEPDSGQIISSDDFGIVVNETFTSTGQEFYRRFTDFWREKSDFESYTLIIVERPSRRYGNKIFVNFNQKTLFSSNLPNKIDAIRALSADAVEKTYANIISESLRMTGNGDVDIRSDGKF